MGVCRHRYRPESALRQPSLPLVAPPPIIIASNTTIVPTSSRWRSRRCRYCHLNLT
ncbi:hypothetical protein Hanom_Chr02g00125601 [Helianthus anomalus]